VIKLFNAILVASKEAEEVGGGKAGLGGAEGKQGLTKEGFLDLVRKG